MTLTALGIPTLGRPSANGGAYELVDLIRRASISSERSIVVLGEWDQDEKTQKWTGRDGAIRTASTLDTMLNEGLPGGELRVHVHWAITPNRMKDARAWVWAQHLDPTCADEWSEAGERFVQSVKIVETGQQARERLGREEQEEAGRRPEPAPYQLTLIDSKTFATMNHRPKWLIRKVVAKDQPIILGGPRKSLKTSVVVDLAISLGSGTPFLGRFEVSQPVKVALLILKRYGGRVCGL
jgi:hypothetical protein